MSIGFESGTPRQFIKATIIHVTPTQIQIDRQRLQANPNDYLQTETRCIWIMPENQQINSPQAPISVVEEEESSDDDDVPPFKRRKPETAAERLGRREDATKSRVKELQEELGLSVAPAAVKKIVLAEKIVQYKMRASNYDIKDYHLKMGSNDYYVDNVTLSADGGWFDEFKRLSTYNSHTARGQVDHYGWLLRKEYGHRLKSRIVFFTERSDEMSTFKSIVENYTDNPCSYGLDEVVLVHVSKLDVVKKDARLKVLALSNLQGDIVWTEEEVGV